MSQTQLSRKPLIAGNWKMYKTGQEAVETATQLVDLCTDIQDIDIMIAPTTLSLALVAQIVQNSNINVGSQNLYFEKEGAFTGEVSAEMVKSAGAKYAIIGHSERRQFFGDTDVLVNQKLRSAVSCGLKPVLCIGETEEQRDAEKTFLTLDKQVSDGLKGFGRDELTDLVLAYEPVWAIGTGKTANTQQVDEVHQYLRSLLGNLFSETFACSIRILYGGSVKPSNIKDLMCIKDVDGALVGGASLDADTFFNIINYNS